MTEHTVFPYDHIDTDALIRLLQRRDEGDFSIDRQLHT